MDNGSEFLNGHVGAGVPNAASSSRASDLTKRKCSLKPVRSLNDTDNACSLGLHFRWLDGSPESCILKWPASLPIWSLRSQQVSSLVQTAVRFLFLAGSGEALSHPVPPSTALSKVPTMVLGDLLAHSSLGLCGCEAVSTVPCSSFILTVFTNISA